MYVAAFLLPKIGDAPDPRHTGRFPLPTTDAIWHTVRGGDIQAELQVNCIEAAEANRVFHWPLEFPAVMARGGFDAVVGNPPWERLTTAPKWSSLRYAIAEIAYAALQGNDRNNC